MVLIVLLKYYLPAILWAICIAVLSLMPAAQLPKIELDLLAPDKLAHAFVYGVLTILLFWAFAKNQPLRWPIIRRCMIASAGYGILLEWAQYAFFPSRYFEVYDIIANIIGIIISLLFVNIFK
jgi:VanZ family protein